MKLKKHFDKVVENAVSLVTGGGLSQKENLAEGKKYINKDMSMLLRKVASEGVVLLKNDGTLPIKNKVISLFGRCQFDYFYVGYGSGGDVHPPYKVNLVDGLKNSKLVTLNNNLLSVYEKWVKDNPVSHGYWGHWPYNFAEMELPDELVRSASENSDVAVIVLGRAAGEDRENKLVEGSYYLTKLEKDMLTKVTNYFSKVVVILDCGNIIDMSWVNDYGNKLSAIIYAYQLGQESGNAVSDVITGITNSSGKLTDSIAINYKDYPSSVNFGGKNFNNYAEDIFVGYRYFETFNKKVLYPFGYGLSYTDFSIEVLDFNYDNDDVIISVKVTNTGNYVGKQVVQLYHKAPITKLSKPVVQLVAFNKTSLIKPNESEVLMLKVNKHYLRSFDDMGVTGYKNCYVLEKGEHTFLVGSSVKDLAVCGMVKVTETEYDKRDNICPVSSSFNRLTCKQNDDAFSENYEKVDIGENRLKQQIIANLPVKLPKTKQKYTFDMVKSGEITLDKFVSSLPLKDLISLTKGEGGMNSKQGENGNAGAFAGITSSLRKKGVPPVITCDGPAGIRLKKYTSLLPCGTSLASSFNEKLVEELYKNLSVEMSKFNVDVLLAPGMNIHRNVLCGRNFEYFSEDPILTGKMASAVVRGLQNNKFACPKHFALNNQETNRNNNNSVVSERALREIYLKPFEICIKESEPKCIMTSYNKVNGVWCHYNYDLVTKVLRKELGFKGVVITDWWMQKAHSPEFPRLKNNGYRVRSGVNVLMPGSLSRVIPHTIDLSLLPLNKDSVQLSELQQNAKYVLNIALKK